MVLFNMASLFIRLPFPDKHINIIRESRNLVYEIHNNRYEHYVDTLKIQK